ncbi:hypothetical protein BSKO_11757 [Bryopsis sp. KO-2023]|nr:hypothetical protein BSKO_11757 [Bryopsis sp. KO-2023]
MPYTNPCVCLVVLGKLIFDFMFVWLDFMLYCFFLEGTDHGLFWVLAAENPPLCNHKLSFFDDFRIVNGVPVFALNPNKCRKSPSKPTQDSSSSEGEDAARKTTKNHITCCAISADGSRIVSGHNDGSAMIWSTEHGTLLHEVEQPTKLSVIPDIRFLDCSNDIVLACDLHGGFMRWNVKAAQVEYGECAPNWDDISNLPNCKPIARCPTFSKDTTTLVFPVTYLSVKDDITNEWETKCSFFYFDAQQTLANRDVMDPKLVVTTSSFENDYKWSLLGNKSEGLLAGFESRASGFMFAWPKAGRSNPVKFELQGTMGCWSPEDDFVASWNIPIKGSLKREAQECYIWHKATDERTTLVDPEGGIVFWADFIPNLHDRLGVAACVVQSDMEILLWELETSNVLHRLRTDMTYDIPADVPPWDDSWLNVQRSYRLRSISLSGDGRWLGVYCNAASKGRVWDVRSGIEVFNFSNPDDMGTHLDGNMLVDVLFSERGDRFVVCSKETVIVWQTNALGPSHRSAGVSRLALRSADDRLATGQVQCKFSADGNMVGMCRVYSTLLSVWDLIDGRRQTLILPRIEEWEDVSELSEKNSAVFCLFAFSMDGTRVAASMADLSVHIWHLGGGEDVISSAVRLGTTRTGTLSAKRFPAWAMCFSVDPVGNEMVVMCEHSGNLVWFGVNAKLMVERRNGFGLRRARFAQDGRTGVLMENDEVAHIWDLVHRRLIRRVDFNISLGPAGPIPFPHNISLDGSFAFAGIERGVDPLDPQTRFVTCRNDSTQTDLANLHKVPRNVVMTDNPEWVVVDEFVDLYSDVGTPVLPTCQRFDPPATQDVSDSGAVRYPEVDFLSENESWSYMSNVGSRKEEHAPTDSVTLLHVGGAYSPKVLHGKDLLPHKFMATSSDGRRVACLSDDNSVFVWTAFATKGSLPAWQDLEVSGECNDPVRMKELLEEHGPALLNFPDHEKKTIPIRVVMKRDHQTLETLMSYAVKNGILVNLICAASAEGEGSSKTVAALKLALKSRALECVEILLNYLPEGLTTPVATADIYKMSINKLSRVFPTAFHRVLSENFMVRDLPDILVPENTFWNRPFEVMTSNMLTPSMELLEHMWNERLEIDGASSYKNKMIRAYPKVVLYPGVADVGMKGLLKQIALRQPTSDHSPIYSSLAIRAIIRQKWTAYGRSILIEEMASFTLQWLTFTVFAIFLGSVWDLVTIKDFTSDMSDRHFESKEVGRNIAAAACLTLSWILSVFSLAREMNRLIDLVMESKLRGLVYWMGSFWNWLDLTTHLLLVLCIGPLYVFIASSGRHSDDSNHADDPFATYDYDRHLTSQEGQKRLTILVCLVSILLSWKTLHFAQAFRWTAPMVLMIFETMKSISVFLGITFGLVFGFAIAFFVLFRVEMQKPGTLDMTDEDKDEFDKVQNRFGNLWLSMVTAFRMMLGETQLDRLSIFDTKMRIVGTIMFIVYLLASMVILLNLLIAVMGDSFDQVKSLEVRHFHKVMIDLELMMSRHRRRVCSDKVERYVHVLMPDKRHQGDAAEQNELFEESMGNLMSEMRGVKAVLEVNGFNVPEHRRTVTGLRNAPTYPSGLNFGCHYC